MEESTGIDEGRGGLMGWAGLALLMALYSALFIIFIHRRYLALELYFVADTGANIQALWSAVHGPFFTSTILDYLKPVPHNLLGDQLYFTLLFYLPFQLAFKSPFSLVAVMVLAVSTGAVPLYLHERRETGGAWAGLLLSDARRTGRAPVHAVQVPHDDW